MARPPLEVGALLPFSLLRLGGRFLGCWAAFLAVLAGWAAVGEAVEGQDATRLSQAALVIFPLAGLIAALPPMADLDPARTAPWIIMLGVLTAAPWPARVSRPIP